MAYRETQGEMLDSIKEREDALKSWFVKHPHGHLLDAVGCAMRILNVQRRKAEEMIMSFIAIKWVRITNGGRMLSTEESMSMLQKNRPVEYTWNDVKFEKRFNVATQKYESMPEEEELPEDFKEYVERKELENARRKVRELGGKE